MKIMKKRLTILFFAMATAVCLGVGLSACGSESDDVVRDSSGKQVPVYQGMVISSADTATTLSSDVNVYAGATAAPSASAEATSPVTGDVNIEGVDIDTQILVEGEDTQIEDEIEATFGVSGAGQSIYYADPGEDIFVTVKLSNPDKFEIMSFVLNGEKYTSYMFESGSDLENLIVKLNVGTKAGFSEYTIDEIKYVDGTEIKDVILDGDTTVKCGVRTDNLPYATVTNETVTLDEISMDVKVTDLYNLISESDGYCMAVLFDGSENTIYTEYLEAGTNSVTFSSLKANTVYQYAVFAVYDDLSGAGVTLTYLYTENFKTKNIVLFDNVEVTKTGVSFSYLWYDGYENATINKLSLESEGDIKLTLLENSATEVTGLLSNHNYTLTASYIGLDGNVESIHISFTTYAMETPEVTIDSLTSTKTDITYSVSVNDEDKIGYVSSVKVTKGEEIVSSGLLLSGTVSDLLSDNEYTLTVVYTYDLNDGNDNQTLEVSKSVFTLAKVTPTVTIDSLTSTKEEIEYALSVVDEDGVGAITSVTLYKDNETVSTSQVLTGTVSDLLSDNEYTLTVVYTYDLNDGNGNQTLEVSKSVSTLAKVVPVVTFDSVTSSKTEIGYTISVTDEDEIGSLTSVTVYHDGDVVATDTTLTGEVSNLLSNNKYTIVVEYTYDANDGEGAQVIAVSESITTEAMAIPEVTVDITSTKTDISYSVSVTDEDEVGEITSVAIVGASGTTSAGTEMSGEIGSLLSNNEYTLTVVYTYDLNDGNGGQTLEVTKSVTTLAMESPVAEIVLIDSATTEITFCVLFNDNDGVGTMTGVGLYADGVLVEDDMGVYTGERTYTELSSYTEYTLVVSYTYDLNDGNGDRIAVLTYSAKTDPIVEFSSVSIINTSAVSEGETITIKLEVVNPNGVEFDTVTVNGIDYRVSEISTESNLYVNIVNDGQFLGGDTVLSITSIVGSLDGIEYVLTVSENSSVSIFINGELYVEDFSLVRFVNSTEEEVQYAFKSEQIYYKIELMNATGYTIYSVTLDGVTYSDNQIDVSDDKQTLYVSYSGTNTGWRSAGFSEIRYGNEILDNKTISFNLSVDYLRLASDQVVEIYTAEQLKEVSGYEYYLLMNNISLSGYEWANINNSMYGVFDGNGYTISGIGAVSTYTNTGLNLGLFSYAQGIVMNLEICDVLYIVTLSSTSSSSYAVYAGGLAAQSGHLILENCNVTSAFQITNETDGAIYIGTLSGYSSSAAELKNVVTELTAVIEGTDNYYTNGFFGRFSSSYSMVNIDSSCTCNISVEGDNIRYIVEGEYKFSYKDGEYMLVEYLGSRYEKILVLPETVEGHAYGIADNAFYNYYGAISGVEEIILPEGLTYIGYSAFAYSNLKKIVIPGSVQKIDYAAFERCPYLEIVILEEGVETIGTYVFYECTELKTVVLPSSLKTIDSMSFYLCKNLDDVYYCGTSNQWSDVTKSGSYITNNAQNIYFYSETAPSTNGNFWHYVDGEIVVWYKEEA